MVSLNFWLALSSRFYRIFICFCRLVSLYAPELMPRQFFFFSMIFFWKLLMCTSMFFCVYFYSWMALVISLRNSFMFYILWPYLLSLFFSLLTFA
jgi:hypothetical protein